MGLWLCCPRLVLLSALFVLVSLWVFVCVVVSFSLTDYTQKRKGTKVLPLVSSLRVLCVLNSCIVIEKLPRCVFGFFQFVGFVLPTNACSIRRLARSYFDFLRHYVDITNNCSAFLK